MAIEAASVVIRFTGDSSHFDSTVTRVRNDTRNFGTAIGQSMQRAGAGMRRFGMGLTAFAAPLAGVFTFSVKAAMNFESAFANVVKTVDGTEEELSMLRDTIREMATDPANPLSALDGAAITLSNIAAIGGQLGVAVEDLEMFTQQVGLLTVATNMGEEEAGMFMGRFMELTGMDISWVDNFSAALVHMGNTSAATEGQIADISLWMAQVASSMGFTELEILGLATRFAELDVTGEVARTAMMKFRQSAVEATADGGYELRRFADTAGISMQDFTSLFEDDVDSAFTLFLDGLGKLDSAAQLAVLEDLELDGLRTSDAFLRLAGDTDALREKFEEANRAAVENTAAMEEARKKADTTEGGINRLKNQLNDLGITIGDTVKPHLDDMADALGPIVEDIGKWVEKNPELTTGIGLVTVGLLGLGLAGVALGIVFSGLGVIIGGVAAVMFSVPAAILGIVLAGGALLLILAGFIFGFDKTKEKIEDLTGLDLSGFDNIALALDSVRAVFFSLIDLPTKFEGGMLKVASGGSAAVWFASFFPPVRLMLDFWKRLGGQPEDFATALDDLAAGQFDFGNILGALAPVIGALSRAWDTAQKLMGLDGSTTGTLGGTTGTLGQSTLLPGHPNYVAPPFVPPPTSNQRQHGGPVQAGQMYVWQEAGVEAFIPSTNGFVMNHAQTNRMLGSGGGQSINIGVVNVHGVQNVKQLIREIERAVGVSNNTRLMLKDRTLNSRTPS